jgi:chromosome segregation ATPase
MANESAAGDMAGKYEAERQRLAKLWDAYEKQEKEMASLKEKIGHLESDLLDRDRIVKSLKDVLETRDRRTRELEIEMTSLRGDKTGWEPRLKALETDLRLERERFAKLFALAEELEEEVKLAKKAIESRDEWYRSHVDVLGDLNRAMEDYDRMMANLGKQVEADKAALDKLSKQA